jgi:hypothetical protein
MILKTALMDICRVSILIASEARMVSAKQLDHELLVSRQLNRPNCLANNSNRRKSMSSRKSKCVLVIAFTVLSACAEQQPQPIIQTLQSGDGALTCEQIASQVQHLDQIAYGSTAASDPMRLINAGPGVQAVVNNIAGYAGARFLSAVPTLSGVLGMATGVAGNASIAAAQQQANAAAMARERVQYLAGLYQEKHCSATEMSQAGSRAKSVALSANDVP